MPVQRLPVPVRQDLAAGRLHEDFRAVLADGERRGIVGEALDATFPNQLSPPEELQEVAL